MSVNIRAVEQAEAEHEYREAQADANFASEVLRRQIDWKHYADENKLTSKDCNLMLGYDQQDATTQADYLEEQGPALAGLFLKILATIANVETVEYTVILIDQLFTANRSAEQIKAATNYFLQFSKTNPTVDITAPLLSILTTNGQHNPFTFLRVQHILSILLAASYGTPEGAALDEKQQRLTVVQFLRYLISKISTLSNSSPASASSSSQVAFPSLSSPTSAAAANRELMACLTSLKNLLRSSAKIQELFAEQDGVRAIANLLNKETQNAQLLYLVGFNIWLLSFHKQIAVKLKEFGIIKKLVQVVKVNVMEKVIRISFSILRNFLDHNNDSFNEDMIGHGLVTVVDTLLKRKFKDPDILSDMTRIQEVLFETIKNMSTFEKYSVEVQSGALVWSNPAHKNEIFWRENINAFDAKNFDLVQQLIKWAGAAPGSLGVPPEREEMIKEIACFDLGEFARFHPEGKKVVHRYKGKEVLMKNLQDKSPKVSKAALLATQKLMVANWEFLNKSSSGGVASLVSAAAKRS